ncbi:MAG: hypothetical protein K2X47_05700, partial [Bdellovibrionales bacterium]|nr:hypothetical protein [Bdellovibrionales bacterium]
KMLTKGSKVLVRFLPFLKIGLLLTGLLQAHAVEKAPGGGPSFCDTEAQFKLTGDPYFEPAYIRGGEFTGKCAGLYPSVRVPKVLSPDEASFVLPYLDDHDIVIANVYFQGDLYVARIPLNARMKVSVVKDFFRYPASHGTLLFEFADPQAVQLIPQRRGAVKQARPVQFLAYNLTGVVAEMDPLSLHEAFYYRKRVAISRVIHAYLSIQEFSKSTAPNRRQEVFSLTVSPEGAGRILAEGIRHSVRRGYADFFSGLNHNCIYDMFEVIDSALGLRSQNEDQLRPWWDITPFFRRLPPLIEDLLEQRKLWKKGKSKIFVLREGSKL